MLIFYCYIINLNLVICVCERKSNLVGNSLVSFVVFVLDLVKSGFNHLFQLSDQLEFVSSGLSGKVVFVGKGCA